MWSISLKILLLSCDAASEVDVLDEAMVISVEKLSGESKRTGTSVGMYERC